MHRVADQPRLSAQTGEPRDLSVRRDATARNSRHYAVDPPMGAICNLCHSVLG